MFVAGCGKCGRDGVAMRMASCSQCHKLYCNNCSRICKDCLLMACPKCDNRTKCRFSNCGGRLVSATSVGMF